jgi:hypothetical protein
MKLRMISGFMMALLVLSMSLVSAQGRRGGGQFGGGGGLQLLRIAEVQKELKMTPEQVGKIDAKQQEVRQAMQELRQGGGNQQQLSEEDRAKRTAKMQEIQTKAVKDILDEKQVKRFNELQLQQQGPLALARKDIADELKLTDEQKQKIVKIQTDMNEERRAAMQGVNFQEMSEEERAKMMTKMQDMQKAAGDKVVAVLTDEQKKKWKEMTGEPFKFPAQQNRRSA